MPRIIQRRITTIQIFSAEITWADEEGLDDSTVIVDASASPVTPQKPRRTRKNSGERTRKRSRKTDSPPLAPPALEAVSDHQTDSIPLETPHVPVSPDA